MALVALVCALVAHFAGSSQLSDYPFEIKGTTAITAPAGDTAPPGLPAGASNVTPGDASVLAAQAPVADADASDESQQIAKKRVDRTLAVIFLIVTFFSLFAICVDMDARWAMIYVSGIVIFFLVMWIINISTGFMPRILEVLDHITPMANSQFYLGVFLVWCALFFISILVTRFHYVRIEANEVIVVGGMLERQQRYSTMRMRYTKEIHDVMEYYLPFVRSGRLIISFPEQSEAVIIDNVLNIRKVTAKLDRMVSAFQIVGD